MLELYIIRHGLAGTPSKKKVIDDKRPLEKKGKKLMKDVAKGLKKQKIGFDIILTSPLIRAKESADIVHEYCGESKKVIVTELLSPESSFTSLIRYLNGLKKVKKIAIVGHEPFLSAFASYCLTKDKNPLFNLEKSGVLKLEINKTLKPGQGLLSWLMGPKQIIHKKS